MALISAAIIDSNGKPILSRQFKDISSIKIGSILSIFPKLLGNGRNINYVEKDDIRYIYRPLDDLFLLLVTSLESNFLSDLDLLNVLSKSVLDICNGQNEASIRQNCFEIIHAIDEAVFQGYKQISKNSFDLMKAVNFDSKEDQLMDLMLKSKEDSAKKIADKKVKDFKEM
ncbi:hypothetical protein MHBO_004463, partial [Bonamia ostreae]